MNRRVKAVRASHELLIDMFTEGWKSGGLLECTRGVPPDAIFVAAYTVRDDVWFLFTHPDFENVLIAQEIPTIDVVIATTTYYETTKEN